MWKPFGLIVCCGRPLGYVRHKLFLSTKSGVALSAAEWPALTNSLKIAFEKKWGCEVTKGTFDVNNNQCEKKYILSMFPYPSGNLHMGHVRVYAIGDAIARFHRLNGKNVLHPIGFDAFGLPAENAAIERKIPADSWTWSNINAMRSQLKRIGFSFDWDRELVTCSPVYYKFTQHLFLLIYEQGLVYSQEDLVNWDPVDKTVLANEQVDEHGKSWRSGAVVEKKLLKQWFIQTTKFAQNLLNGLESTLLEDWRDIKNLQTHWIGDCTGSRFQFKIIHDGKESGHIKLWTRHPEFLHKAAFIVATPGSYLDLKYGPKKGKLGVNVLNPLNNKLIPVYVTENASYDEGCGEKVVIPFVDPSLDWVAKELNIEWTLEEMNEDKFERSRVCDLAKAAGIGGDPVSSKLKDWLISRQRNWGTPIPLVTCNTCGTVPLKFEDLPVHPPTAGEEEVWGATECPSCGGPANRVADTMDTFVDSAWYFLRYLDPHNDSQPYSVKLADRLMPVDLYVGGKEHAVLHLYYARFFGHFLHSIGLLKEPEPFKRLVVQGMVLGKTYQDQESGKFLTKEDVVSTNGEPINKDTGKKVKESWEKMSKSKHNGVEPDEILDDYGIDTTRLFILSDVAPTSNKMWNSERFPGILNWQKRIWSLMEDFLNSRKNSAGAGLNEDMNKINEDLRDSRNYYLKGVSHCYSSSHQLSVAISKMQGLTNSLKKFPKSAMGQSHEFEKTLCYLLIMLAPITPHFASELWSMVQESPGRINSSIFRWSSPLLQQSWPKLDHDYKMTVNFAVNNAIKDSILLPYDDFRIMTEQDALEMALQSKKVNTFMRDCDIKNTIFTKQPDYEATLNIKISHEQWKSKAQPSKGSEVATAN